MVIPELLNGGLVTAKDPAFLHPGELTKAINGMYFPDADGIQRAPGFASMATISSASGIYGLNACRFDSGSYYLLAQTTAAYWLSSGADSDAPTFTSAEAVSSGTQVTTVKYNNKFYVFNGVNDNRVLTSGGTFRPHGLKPVPGQPATGTSAVTFALPSTGYYEYWYTEVAKYAVGDEVESAYDALPATVLVSNTSASPVLYLPATANNSSATHFRIYRGAGTKVNSFDDIFPNGYAVKDVVVGTTAFVDGGTAANTSGYAANSDNDQGVFSSAPGILANGLPSGSGINSESNATGAANGSGAVRTYATTATSNRLLCSFLVYNFGLLPSGNITGLKVEIVARASRPSRARLVACVGKRTAQNTLAALPANATYPTGVSPDRFSKEVVGLTTAYATYTLGGPSDDWLPTIYNWSTDDVASSAFAVGIGMQFLNGSPSADGDTIEVDSVKLTAYYSGPSPEDFGAPYPAVTLELGGQQVSFSSNKTPPLASCGAIHEGQLVTDDVAHPGQLVYMIAGTPDAHPAGAYFLPLETAFPIKYIGVVNQRLIAATQTEMYRINYLPTEIDASINRGQAFAKLSSVYGILHAKAADFFTGPDGVERLAFVSPNVGVCVTDGLSVTPFMEDLDWVGPSGIITAIDEYLGNKVISLTNDPGTQTLRLLLSNGFEYVASYARRHFKSGFKWSGPVYTRLAAGGRTPTSMAVVRRTNGSYIPIYGYSSGTGGGTVYRQDADDMIAAFKHALPDSANNKLRIKTRTMYLAQMGQQVELDGLYVYGREMTSANTASNLPDCAVTAYQSYTNAAQTSATVENAVTDKASQLAYRPLSGINADAIAFELEQSSTNNFEFLSLGLKGQGYGQEANRA